MATIPPSVSANAPHPILAVTPAAAIVPLTEVNVEPRVNVVVESATAATSAAANRVASPPAAAASPPKIEPPADIA